MHFSLRPLSMKVVTLTVQHEQRGSYCLPSEQFQRQPLEKGKGSSPCPPFAASRGRNGGRRETNAGSEDFHNETSCRCSVDRHSHADLTTLRVVQSVPDSPGITKGWRELPSFCLVRFSFFSRLTKEMCTWVVAYMYRTPQSINKKKRCRQRLAHSENPGRTAHPGRAHCYSCGGEPYTISQAKMDSGDTAPKGVAVITRRVFVLEQTDTLGPEAWQLSAFTLTGCVPSEEWGQLERQSSFAMKWPVSNRH